MMMPALRQVGRAAKEISNAAAKDGAAASKATQDLGISLPSMPKMDWVSNAQTLIRRAHDHHMIDGYRCSMLHVPSVPTVNHLS